MIGGELALPRKVWARAIGRRITMQAGQSGAPPRALLVTDFDGTMTRHDFYKLAAQSLLPPEMPDYWGPGIVTAG